jgi:hypothetical protein
MIEKTGINKVDIVRLVNVASRKNSFANIAINRKAISKRGW